ncbi:hypothetical protein Tco_0611432 [Tanacetum coccineum]
MPLEGIHVDDKLQFVEEPVEIMEREIKRLKRSRIPLVKVRWNSRRGPEFTWEREDSFKQKYPQLFTNRASSSTTRTEQCNYGNVKVNKARGYGSSGYFYFFKRISRECGILFSMIQSQIPERHVSPTTSILEIPTAPILPAPSAVVAPSSEFPLAPIDAQQDSSTTNHSSSGHSILGYSLPRHTPPDTTDVDSSTLTRFVHPSLARTLRCSEGYLRWRFGIRSVITRTSGNEQTRTRESEELKKNQKSTKPKPEKPKTLAHVLL